MVSKQGGGQRWRTVGVGMVAIVNKSEDGRELLRRIGGVTEGGCR